MHTDSTNNTNGRRRVAAHPHPAVNLPPRTLNPFYRTELFPAYRVAHSHTHPVLHYFMHRKCISIGKRCWLPLFLLFFFLVFASGLLVDMLWCFRQVLFGAGAMHAILIRLPKLNAIPLKHELHTLNALAPVGGIVGWKGDTRPFPPSCVCVTRVTHHRRRLAICVSQKYMYTCISVHIYMHMPTDDMPHS